MTPEELRLELLKLAYSHGRTSAEAVERARALEEYVTGKVVNRPTISLPKKTDKG